MDWLTQKKGFEEITQLGREKNPFLFIISYDKEKIFAQPLNHLDKEIFYKVENFKNYPLTKQTKDATFLTTPLDFKSYQQSFNQVLHHIRLGESYLLNLTFKTPIKTNYTLKEIFTSAKAKYKLYYKDEFICFSPEKFIEIENNTIATYPMKGTIDANIPQAKEKILNSEKEKAEHIMIVDLMRNDLGIIGENVKVNSFRDIQKIQAGEKILLQVTSKITASLPSNWKDDIGTLLNKLLPAGSITGTPKKSTIKIISKIENFKREFYTGVFGIFDGTNLHSSVMIRFIEKKEHKLYYKSGGGITLDSKAKLEHQELLDKIYLPF